MIGTSGAKALLLVVPCSSIRIAEMKGQVVVGLSSERPGTGQPLNETASKIAHGLVLACRIGVTTHR